jgi:RNA polymerase sigma-70 factor (ECF subfamily)
VGVGLTVEEAYRKWADDLVRYGTAVAGPCDAPDVVAEAFASVLAGGQDAWDAVREPRRYLYRAVLNAARARARSRGRRERREWRVGVATPVGESLSDPGVVAALARLSPQQRAVVFLTYWEDLRPADVAAVLGISEGSVKRHLARARSSLREALA